LAGVQVVLWHVARNTSGGISNNFAYLAIALLPVLMWRVFTKVRLHREKFRIQMHRESLAVATSIATTIGVFVVQWRFLLGSQGLTISGVNNDVVSYAQFAQHLLKFSTSDTGRIVGLDGGRAVTEDVFGPLSFLALNQWLTKLSFAQLLLPSLLVAVTLMSVSLTHLVCGMTKVNGVIAGFVAALAQSTPLLGYVSGNFFLSQIIGTAIAIQIVALMMQVEVAGSWRDIYKVWRTVLVLALLTSAALLTYPPLAVIVPLLVLVPTVLFVKGFSEGFKTLSVYFIGSLIGAIVVLDRTIIAVERSIFLSRVVAGWPLPAFALDQLLGNLSSEVEGITLFSWSRSAIILLLLVAVCAARLLLLKDRLLGVGPIFVLVALSTYMILYLRGDGPTYQAWKWATFMIPFLVAAVVGPLLDALLSGFNRDRMRNAIVAVMLLLAMSINLNRFDSFYGAVSQAVPVTSELRDIGESKELIGISKVNVATGPYSQSMWPALFLGDRTVSIVSPSYYSSPPMFDAWSIVPYEDDLERDSPGSRRIGNSYLLVPPAVANGYQESGGLSSLVFLTVSDASVTPDKELQVSAEVRNTSETPWTSYGALRGSTYIGLRVSTALGGNVIREERVATAPFPRVIRKGESVMVSFDFKISTPGRYVIEVSPVTEFVAWFGDLDPNFSGKALVTVIQ
jgi:hypothetical protein